MKGIHILVFILILNSLIPVFVQQRLNQYRCCGEKGVKQMMIITIQSIVMESFWIQLQ